jgi:multicomponent K+:H+ antiporter subunit A
MSLLLVVALPFTGGLLAATLPSASRNRTAALAGVTVLLSLAGVALRFRRSRPVASSSSGSHGPRRWASISFMGAMLGVVLAGNLLQLAFFWELTSLLSFLLIGYWHQRKDAQRGARMALAVTGAGGLALLAGVIVLGHVAGSYELDAVLAAGERVRAHPLYPVALVLVLLGAFTKSAQVPFQFWLPRAMAAPTPVSARISTPRRW